MSKINVYLFLKGQFRKCALLRYEDNKYYFAYGKKYISDNEAVAIDPLNLPLYEKTFESDALFGAIRDCSPDRWGRYLLEKNFNRTLSDLEYILANGIEHVGALAFSPSEYEIPMRLTPSGFVPHREEEVSLDLIINQTELAIKNEADRDKLKELLQYGPSLGGARPKYSIKTGGISYLAKYGISQDRRREPLIEYATMKLATDLNLNVTEIKTGKVALRDVFYIERFDRSMKEKFPYISALTLCEWDENQYADWSYLVFCENLGKIAQKEKSLREDLKELFRRVAFNIAVNNNDDHPRNHGILYLKGEWRLSPLFDVVPLDTNTQTFSLSMEIGVERKIASRNNLLSSHEHFRISKAEAEKLIDEINIFVKNSWKNYFQNAGLTKEEVILFENAFSDK